MQNFYSASPTSMAYPLTLCAPTTQITLCVTLTTGHAFLSQSLRTCFSRPRFRLHSTNFYATALSRVFCGSQAPRPTHTHAHTASPNAPRIHQGRLLRFKQLPAGPLTLTCETEAGRGREATGARPVATGASSAHSGFSNMRVGWARSPGPHNSPRAERVSSKPSAQSRRN